MDEQEAEAPLEISEPMEAMEPMEMGRFGKDELNLIEHPFASLWKNESEGAVIFHQWSARHPVSGKSIPASWRVEGSTTMGLPNASDERVYLVLMELTREAGFENSMVSFTRYDVIRRLNWPDDKKHYEMLLQAFERLNSVTITARNSFWDPTNRVFRNVGFSLIDVYDIAAEKPGRKRKDNPELPLSYFKWNDVLFQSFQNGYIRSLDLPFALSLKGDITLRLYRYLDKKSYDSRRLFEIDLAALCERHLGMRTSPYPSKLKERLKGAHDELISRGFLERVEYVAMKTKKGEKVCYTFAPRVGANAAANFDVTQPALPFQSDDSGTEHSSDGETSDQSTLIDVPIQILSNGRAAGAEISGTEVSGTAAATSQKDSSPELGGDGEEAALLQRLLNLKISAEVIAELLKSTSLATLKIQLDCLSDRAPRDAAATLIKAVREEWEPPKKYFDRLEARRSAQKSQDVSESQKRARSAQRASERQQTARLQAEADQLDATFAQLDSQTQQRIEVEARSRLGLIGRLGRAQGALEAMRRNVMREMLNQGAEST